MTLRIVFLFAFTVINQIEAAANAKRVLIENTIWTDDASKNPYNLTSDVQIPFNSTLTIRPGVIINFGNGDFEILVKGFLRVEGTLEKPVIFQGGLVDNEKWMIKFQSTQLSLSSISYAHFIGPKKALQLVDVPDGIQENNGTLIIQSSIFSDSTRVGANGAYPRWSTPSVPALLFQSCTFNQTTILSRGVDSEPITIRSGEIYDSTFYSRTSYEGIEINNCNLANITINYDLYYYQTNFRLNNSTANRISLRAESNTVAYHFNVRQSTIQDFAISHFYYYGSSGYLNSVTFEDSTISNVSLAVSYYPGYFFGTGYTVVIRNCLYNGGTLDFTNILVPISVTIQSSHLRNVNIIQTDPRSTYTNLETRKLILRNSTFIDGRILFQNGQSDISYSTITLATPPLTLNGNSIITCSSVIRSSSVLIQDTVGISAVGLTLSYTTIKNFATAIRTYPTYSYRTSITNTNFIGNALCNIDNQAIYDVYTQGVYWGTNNSGVILHKIRDYWDNIDYGNVISSDYSLNILAAETSCPPYGENEAVGTTWTSVTEI